MLGLFTAAVTVKIPWTFDLIILIRFHERLKRVFGSFVKLTVNRSLLVLNLSV